MDLQTAYDDLENIVDTLDVLIKEISLQEYIEEFEWLKMKAISEKQDVEVELQAEYDREEEEMNRQFINERI